jgi:hypothetical protein
VKIRDHSDAFSLPLGGKIRDLGRLFFDIDKMQLDSDASNEQQDH